MRRLFSSILLLGLASALPSVAKPLTGQKEIFLVDDAGHRILIGYVKFSQNGETTIYDLEFNDEVFSEHFLSMRPFKCLEGPDKHWCHVPYPYELQRYVSAEDLTDLEYDLLFIHKGATEYGINMWNGIYYRLNADGDHLVGQLHEMDMDVLSAPPEAGNLRPIKHDDIHESDPDSHWLPGIVIE
ncbi:hypothetical protein [Ruegeria lacuscaerulensis]|uniref:hypothetical protein n=1 Tax=Ruegeria lacuscaerulensis TaxID=55218 RepID=UPI00147BC8E8|nr:hypothetical protein [Ruegeria lacuscaerulensis]